jgi:hypothetical protein
MCRGSYKIAALLMLHLCIAAKQQQHLQLTCEPSMRAAACCCLPACLPAGYCLLLQNISSLASPACMLLPAAAAAASACWLLPAAAACLLLQNASSPASPARVLLPACCCCSVLAHQCCQEDGVVGVAQCTLQCACTQHTREVITYMHALVVMHMWLLLQYSSLPGCPASLLLHGMYS